MVLLPSGPQSTEVDDIAHQLSMQRDEINRLSASLSGIQQGQDWEFDFLRAKEAEFDTIPHPAASMIVPSGTSMISGTDFTTLGFTTNDDATWAFNVNMESSNEIISPSNQPEESVWAFTLWMNFVPSSLGSRALEWIELGGAGDVKVYEFNPSSVYSTWLYINQLRRAGTGDKNYAMKAWQDSGSSMIHGGLFTAYRIR